MYAPYILAAVSGAFLAQHWTQAIGITAALLAIVEAIKSCKR